MQIEFINELDEIEVLEKFPELSCEELTEKAEEMWELMKKFHPYLDINISPQIDLKIEVRPLKREGKKFMRSHLISNFSDDEKESFIAYILELYRPKKSRKTGEVRVIPSCLYFSIFALDNKTKRVTGSLKYAVSNQTIARAHCTQIIAIDLDGISHEEYRHYKDVLLDNGIETVDNFSGHGYQLFVLLDEPSTDLHLQHKVIDVLRENAIPADASTIDCSRIMRIPFVNAKNAGKFELVKCIRLTDTDRRYSLEDFFTAFGYQYAKPQRQLHQKRFNIPGKNEQILKEVVVNGKVRTKKDGSPWPFKTYEFKYDLDQAKKMYLNYPFRNEDVLTLLGAPKYEFKLKPLYLDDSQDISFDPMTGEIIEDNNGVEVITTAAEEVEQVEENIVNQIEDEKHSYKTAIIDFNSYYPDWIDVTSYPSGIREMFGGFREGFADNTLRFLVLLLRKEKLSYERVEELMVLLAQLDTWGWAWDIKEVKRKARRFYEDEWHSVNKKVYEDLEKEFGALTFKNHDDKVDFYRNNEVFISNSIFSKRGSQASVISQLSGKAFRFYLILLRDSHLYYLNNTKIKRYSITDLTALSGKSKRATEDLVKELCSSKIKLLDKKKNNRRQGQEYDYFVNDVARKKTQKGYMYMKISDLLALEYLMLQKQMKENSAVIIFYILFRMQSDTYIRLSQQHIADMLGLGERTVRRLLSQELPATGYVTVVKSKNGVPNGYIINL